MSCTKRRSSFFKKIALFELKTIFRYIVPRKGEVSSSLMSFISLLIITLVTWLSLVFLSVADGIEKGWIQKLTSIHGPIKIIPTQSYYESHYNRIDLYSLSSGYHQKSLKEKKESSYLTTFDPSVDEELPLDFPLPHLDISGRPIDLLSTLHSIFHKAREKNLIISAQEYEITGAMMRLKVFSEKTMGFHLISQASYIMSFDDKNAPLLPEAAPQKTGFTPVFLPKSFMENGAKLNDIGQFTIYNGLSTGSMEENNPFEVVGFYEAGTLQIGPKCIFAPYDFVARISSEGQLESTDPILKGGFRIQTTPSNDVSSVYEFIKKELEREKIDLYFDVIPYYEYGFVKDILVSFQSDRVLYSFVALLVLIVAASNIVSVLLLIVYQSRKEIALFTALGASKQALVRIYSGLGLFLGSLGSFLGLGLGFITMKNLPLILQNIYLFKGYENLFSQSIPTHLSPGAMAVVLIGTPLIALVAGFIPALKASHYKPSELLRLM